METTPFRKPGAILHIPLIILIVWVVYLNSLNNSFQFDDYHSIVDNKNIRELRNIPLFFSDPSTFSDDPRGHMYRPALLISYAINYAINGLDVRGFHFVNILIHSINAAIVYLITRTFLTGWAPFFSSIFFGLLPLNSHAVNYISSRSILLAATFYLLSFYLFIKIFSKSRDKSDTTYYPPYISSLISYIFALLSKEIAITLPLILLLYNYLFSSNTLVQNRRLRAYNFFKHHIPFWVITAMYLLLRKSLFGKAGIVLSKASLIEGQGQSRSIYINSLTQSKVLLLYLKKMFFPVGLSVIHDMKQASSLLEFWVIFSLLIIALLIILGLRTKNKLPLFTFGTLWFFILLLPETIIPLNLIVNEHRAYIGAAGIALCIGLFYKELYNWSGISRYGSFIKRTLITAIVLFLTISGLITINRNRVWQDEYTLWSDAVKKAPDSSMAHYNLGIVYAEKKLLDKAIDEFKEAIRISPRYTDAYFNLALMYDEKGLLDQAIREYKITLNLNPYSADAHNNLGLIYMKNSMLDQAISEFKEALKIKPDYKEAQQNLNRALYLKSN